MILRKIGTVFHIDCDCIRDEIELDKLRNCHIQIQDAQKSKSTLNDVVKAIEDGNTRIVNLLDELVKGE